MALIPFAVQVQSQDARLQLRPFSHPRFEIVEVGDRFDAVIESVTQAPAVQCRRIPAIGGNSHGFDAIGIAIVECANNGSRVTYVDQPIEPAAVGLAYEDFIVRLAHIYETRFNAI